jgi:hypothetical protein
MRRPLAALLLAAAAAYVPLAATPASACPQPAEGEPQCCQPRYLVTADVAGHTVGVPDPTWQPWRCE